MLRSLLQSQSRLVQIGMQPFAPILSRTLDKAFSEVREWNGRKSCLLLSFDCDFPEDALALPEIARDLEGRQIKASFACVGRWVSEYPEEHRAVLEGGHELLNHTFSHPELVNSPGHFVSFRDDLQERHWGELTSGEKREEITRCQDAVRESLDYQMIGFRAPHFGKVDADDLYPMLRELELTYSTSALACRGPQLGCPFTVEGILEIPVTTCPHHPFTSFDSWHAFYAKGGWHASNFVEVFESRLKSSVQAGGLTNIYLDPKDRNRYEFARLLDVVESVGEDCWTPTYRDFVSQRADAATADVRDGLRQ